MSTNMILPFKTNINLPYGRLGQIISWCSDNCNKNWAFDITEEVGEKSSGSYTFSFESEKDFITFMVWQK